MITDALSYPLRGSGVIMLIIGTVIAVLLQVATVGPFGAIALLLFYGYFTAYYYQILQHTATGSDAEPDWPDVTDFDETLSFVAAKYEGAV